MKPSEGETCILCRKPILRFFKRYIQQSSTTPRETILHSEDNRWNVLQDFN